MMDNKPQERAQKSPVNRMIDEDDEPMMQRDKDPRHMVRPAACGKTDKGADDGADL